MGTKGLTNAMANNSQNLIPNLFDSTLSLCSFQYTTSSATLELSPKLTTTFFNSERQTKTQIAWRGGLA